jgi:hypothetical protein
MRAAERRRLLQAKFIYTARSSPLHVLQTTVQTTAILLDLTMKGMCFTFAAWSKEFVF